MKDNPSASKAFRSPGIEPGPIPCNAKTSRSLNLLSWRKVLMPLFSNARLAGAESPEVNPALGFRFFSQMGQVGQSVLLKYLCPFGQIRKFVFEFFIPGMITKCSFKNQKYESEKNMGQF